MSRGTAACHCAFGRFSFGKSLFTAKFSRRRKDTLFTQGSANAARDSSMRIVVPTSADHRRPLLSLWVHHASRVPPPLLYSGKADADPSKCPFFGGPNGGGFGDFNIVTGVSFVFFVFAMNRLLVAAIALGPQRIAAGVFAAICHVCFYVAASLRQLGVWLGLLSLQATG